jgi:hypothetical protein
MMKDIILNMNCPRCGVIHFVVCREEQYNRYRNGELIQVAFNDLTATEREEIITGFCPSCIEETFGGVD